MTDNGTIGAILLTTTVAYGFLRFYRIQIVEHVAKWCLVSKAGWEAQSKAEAEARAMKVGLEVGQ